MKLDNKKLEKYIQQLHATECPLCGDNHWSFSDKVFQLMEFNYGELNLSGSVFPLVLLTCNKCGNTYTINAISAKLIDKPETEEIENNGKEK